MLSRQGTPEPERRPHFSYIDEVQGFTHGMDLPTILSESRKYALSLTIGTQTLHQLPDDSISAVFGNVGTLISFRVSANDAKELVREFAASGEGPRTAEQTFDLIIPATELQNLADFKLYVRTMVNRQPQDAFLVNSAPPLSNIGKPTDAETAVRTSLERYGRSRSEVQNRLMRFLKSKSSNQF